MNIRTRWIAACAVCLLASTARAQTNFPEVEPNSVKAEATAITGILPGDTISGSTTGTGAVAGDTALTTGDVFRVRTAALPLGIYKHRLTLTTSTATGHTGTLRGLNQTGTAGTGSTGGTAGTTDTTIQTTSTATTPPLFNQWYAFGKAEEMYYRVNGAAATTGAYTATFSTSAVAATVISQPFESASPITITTIGQTTADTELFVFDANLDAIPGASNDDDGPAGIGGLQSELTRTYPAGTYYVAVTSFNSAWNFVSPPDDDIFTASPLLDFPGSLVRSASSTATLDWDFAIFGSNGTWTQPAQLPAASPYDILWFQFTTAPGAPPIAPPNDNCANAISVGTGGTLSGIVAGASTDGFASCDPGGGASRDVWYSYTNTNASPRLLTATSCGTTGINDTALSIHSSCGGAELACNDDCGGTPCGGPTSCVSAQVAASQQVFIRVSDKGLGGGGAFTLVTSVAGLPPVHDQCSAPLAVTGLGTFPIDNLAATTGPQGQSDALCSYYGGTGIRQDVWFTWTATNSGLVTVSTCGSITGGPSQDSKIAVYNGAGCPSASAIACNDDAACSSASHLNATATFSAVCGNAYTFQIGMYYLSSASLSGTFSVTSAGQSCASTPTVPFCLGDGTGAPCPCGNNATTPGHGCATTGLPGGALLTSTGFAGASNATDTLVLTANFVTGPTLFIQSNGLALANFGDGHLCAAVGILRLGVVFPSGGVASYPGGLTPNPIHIQGATSNGVTRHYQAWFRSPLGLCNPGAQNFDLTQGLSLVWGP